MKHFLGSILGYGFLILLVTEAMVRMGQLYKGTPQRMIDERGVEKWVPGQNGKVVTGNRRQNVAAYRINNFGFNSYREFEPSSERFEVALIGDSYIEGFHQDYRRSIGKKIEGRDPDITVFEFGYAGYDLADELHLIRAYPEYFGKVDKIFVYLHYPDDLLRGAFEVSQKRLKLQQGAYGIIQKSKLLVYLQNIGFLGSMSNKINKWKVAVTSVSPVLNKPEEESEEYQTLSNFKELLHQPGLDLDKMVFLVDENKFPVSFRKFLNTSGISYVDYGTILRDQQVPVTLIYDQHWNDLGRDLVALRISEFLDTLPEKKARLMKLSVNH